MQRQFYLLIRLQLQVIVTMVTDAARHNYTAPSVIKVGLLQPLEGPLGFERTGSAATMAVRDAQRRGYLNRTQVKYNSTLCLPLSGLIFLTELNRLFSRSAENSIRLKVDTRPA